MYANHAVNFFLYCATGQNCVARLCDCIAVVHTSYRRPIVFSFFG